MLVPVGRPKAPIISRELVIKAALKVVDNEGLAALTLRRLAAELGVTVGSLYHHYRYKDDIVRDVLVEILAPLEPSRSTEPVTDWRDFVLQQCLTYFRLLEEHPNLAALGFSIIPETLGFAAESLGAQVLLDAGVPARYVIAIREQLELAIRGILQFCYDTPLFGEVPKEYPLFRQVVRESRRVSPEQRLKLAIGIILDGIEQRLPEWREESARSAIKPRPAQGRTRARST